MSQILDLAIDVDAEMMTAPAIQACYVESEADVPLEKEEINGPAAELSGAHFGRGLASFVSMGAWRPYGDQLARTMRFTFQAFEGLFDA